MNRSAALDSLRRSCDVLVIGGGATGLGIAVDAVTRGFRTVLVEAGDFAQATSSRATKLVHGGVRYLAGGQFQLVYEALRERAVMLRNAPHLVRAQAFLLPAYTLQELPFYGAGLLLYDLISGRSTLGPTRLLGARASLEQIPNLESRGLRGSILYHDGQFNDARFALALARTAADHGATVLNYVRCTRLLHQGERLAGAVVTDRETGIEYTVKARTVFNAAGIFTDAVRRLDDGHVAPLLTVSRGTHIVVDGSALGGTAGIMVPKTRDGRVIFATPWQGRVVIGTTDLAAATPEMEPGHTAEEIDYLFETVNPFLAKHLGRGDVLSVFSGLRPLVTGKTAATSKISREHRIELSPRGLITVAGGKWTTYRRMAEDALDFAGSHALLERRACRTAATPLHGSAGELYEGDRYLREYGGDAAAIVASVTDDPTLGQAIDPSLPYNFAEVRYAVRLEMARTLEDVLARRTRALLLDSAAAVRAAPGVAAMVAAELGYDANWAADQVREFTALARLDYSL